MAAPSESKSFPVLPVAVAHGHDLGSCVDAIRDLTKRTNDLGQEPYLEELKTTQEAAREQDCVCRLAIVARTPDLLARRQQMLERAMRSGHDLGFLRKQGVYPVCANGPPSAAVVFPGGGMQYPNMLRDVASFFPVVDRVLTPIDAAFRKLSNRDLRSSFWVEDIEAYEERLEDIPCALFAVNIALFELIRQYGFRCDAAMGQSIGDISAMVASGLLSIEKGLEIVWERNRAVLSIDSEDHGRMISLLCAPQKARELISNVGGYAVVAAYNSPSACIVSVSTKVADVVLQRCAKEGVQAIPMQISHGYHSELVAAAKPRYQETVQALSFEPPQCDLVSCITGGSLQTAAKEVLQAELLRQLDEPVQLPSAIETLYESDVRLFVECGPKWALTTYIGEVLADRPHVAQATLHPKVGELEQVFRALACLYAHGLCELFPQT